MNRSNANILFLICINSLSNLVLPNRISYFEPKNIKNKKTKAALELISRGLVLYEEALEEDGYTEKMQENTDNFTFAHLSTMGKIHEMICALSENQKDSIFTYLQRKLLQMKEDKVR